MKTFLLEVGAGVTLIVSGVAVWALPDATPYLGRPPLIVGWLIIGLGALIIVAATVSNSEFTFQSPVRRRQSLAAKQPPAQVVFTADLSMPPASLAPVPPIAERIYAHVAPSEVVRIARNTEMTSAEIDRLILPYLGQWFQIACVVENVSDYTGCATLWLRERDSDIRILADFDGDNKDHRRAVTLRKGSYVTVLGRLSKMAFSYSLELKDCELVEADTGHPKAAR